MPRPGTSDGIPLPVDTADTGRAAAAVADVNRLIDRVAELDETIQRMAKGLQEQLDRHGADLDLLRAEVRSLQAVLGAALAHRCG